MKVLVFGGSGKMGTAVAFDLAREPAVTGIGLVGRRRAALEATQTWLGSAKVAVHPLDIEAVDQTKALLKQYDVAVNTLPDRHTSYSVMQSAAEAGRNLVDMLEEYHRRPDAYETENLVLPRGMTLEQYGDYLHETALANGVTVMDGIGFAPGLSNVTCGEGIRKLDRAESAIARVGGIPAKAAAATRPLRYMITWAFRHVLREYMIKVNVLKDGRIVEVDATTGRECFQFDKFGRNEALECAITPGMPSFIFTRPQLKEFAEKTVRWPGHWDGVATLKECGMLDAEPVDFGGAKVVPREFLLSRIEPRLKANDGDGDVCVMYNTVIGTKNGARTRIAYWLWDEADMATGISSMGRVTGFSAAIGAVMIGKGFIKEKGLVPPEDCIYGGLYDAFMKELEKRNIHVLETIEPLT